MPASESTLTTGQHIWEHALHRARLGVWDWNLVTGECTYSDTWFEMLGYARGDLEQDSELWLRITHPDDRDRALESGNRHLAGETDAIETELRLRHKRGHWVWVLDRGGIIERNAAGEPTRMVGVQTDISSLKNVERALEQVNRSYDLVLEASVTGMWSYDLASGVSHWDDRTRQMFGMPALPAPLEAKIWHSFLHPEDKENAEAAHALKPEGDTPSAIRYRIVLKDGSIRHMETRTIFVPDPGTPGSILGTIRDVSEEVWAADALNMEKEKLRVTLSSISDAVLSTDTGGVITFVNPAAARLIGRPQSQLIGLSLSQVRITQTQVPLSAVFGTQTGTQTADVVRADLDDFSVRWTASAIRAADGTHLGSVYTFQDVTEQQKQQKALSFAANHDALTGLLNRSAFDAKLREHIAQADVQPITVIYIDLDYFKGLNDFAGHAAGDMALQTIGAALRDGLPQDTIVARLGGDEFAIILDTGDFDAADAIAANLLRAIQNADLGISTAHRNLGASIGVALIHDSQTAPADALAFADDACYRAKSSGRNQYAFFSRLGETATSGLTAARIVADIADARAEGRLQLYGQELRFIRDPWVCSGHIEVLARMRTRSGQMISPAEFIPAAERFGMAAPLDRWIIQTALQRHGHTMQFRGGLSLAFNLSAQTLSDPALWETIDQVITDHRVYRGNVVFEITETAAFTNFEAAERFVRAARASGCRVSLDDFGTGLSSFEYLRRFPVDTIKIDGSFIQNLTTQQFDREIVAAISTIAHNMGYDVVAEKIESPQDLNILSEMGVRFGQGFLMHRPEPLDQLIDREFAGQLQGIAQTR
ncbi:EAL domain-containing protein [Devosia sp. J2-20]|uniref:EAL domain-containing protein n=1 Tax=Devosia sp. J2-20 TaxID=3026161 RepID=UPI00249B5F6C|nr:EAL domain-containing protein [Devosia sp. J2-20]WDQ99224.1 EAL domain-containing protein [Devosia sp. J2-20]